MLVSRSQGGPQTTWVLMYIHPRRNIYIYIVNIEYQPTTLWFSDIFIKKRRIILMHDKEDNIYDEPTCYLNM